MSRLCRVLTSKDVPGKNAVLQDEPFLCEKDVQYYGQPIAIVVAGRSLAADCSLVTFCYVSVSDVKIGCGYNSRSVIG